MNTKFADRLGDCQASLTVTSPFLAATGRRTGRVLVGQLGNVPPRLARGQGFLVTRRPKLLRSFLPIERSSLIASSLSYSL